MKTPEEVEKRLAVCRARVGRLNATVESETKALLLVVAKAQLDELEWVLEKDEDGE